MTQAVIVYSGNRPPNPLSNLHLIDRPEVDAAIVERIGEICAEFPRYGYRPSPPKSVVGMGSNQKKAMRPDERAGSDGATASPLGRHDR